jgi:CHAT domain-containing protein
MHARISVMGKASRSKLSTTVAAENYQFLVALVEKGEAASLAEAVDEAVAQLRRSENRRRLAKATSAYFESLSPEELSEESSLANSMHKAAGAVDFDREL